MARTALRFAADTTNRAERWRVALPLLIVPYLVVNLLFTVFSFWHPLGGDGVFVVTRIGSVRLVSFWPSLLAAYGLGIHAL